MNRSWMVVLAACMILQPCSEGKAKKKAELAAIFASARFVHVEALNGQSLDPEVVSEDREAIFDVEKGLHDWKRYQTTLQRTDAELVFVVRKGRLASANARGGIGNGDRLPVGAPPRTQPGSPNAGNGPEVGLGTEMGPPDDLLEIYTVTPSGSLMGPIWKGSMPGGLDRPALPLLRRIRTEVEAAYPQ